MNIVNTLKKIGEESARGLDSYVIAKNLLTQDHNEKSFLRTLKVSLPKSGKVADKTATKKIHKTIVWGLSNFSTSGRQICHNIIWIHLMSVKNSILAIRCTKDFVPYIFPILKLRINALKKIQEIYISRWIFITWIKCWTLCSNIPYMIAPGTD